jgi:ABC-type branched-subunit amino acid transport system substrate-binding protein
MKNILTIIFILTFNGFTFVSAEVDSLNFSSSADPQSIGIILPLSGKYAQIGQKTLNSVALGLGLNENDNNKYKLAVIDSEGNPETARRAVERLVQEDKVIAIIGSLLTKTSSAVATRASELGVPTIALSQKAGVTEISPFVFRNSLTTEMQVHQLVDAAFNQLGATKFAVLFPNDSYGTEYTNIFWDEVLARGGKVVAAQSYDPKETDFRNPIQRLVGTYYIEDRALEYKQRTKDWTEAQAGKRSRRAPPEDILPPVVDFDAIFIPDNSKSFGQIAAMLAFNNVHKVKLLGTNLLNVSDISRRAGLFAQDTFFMDGIFTNNLSQNEFAKEYKLTFGEDPTNIELQGYDSALILKQAIEAGATDREKLKNQLTNMKDFSGAFGSLSMSTEREVNRPLFLFTIDKGSVVKFSPNKVE